MASRLTLRIQDSMARLTRSEHKLAELLLGNGTLIETHSATELAQMAEVSKATTARFFRTLGYGDFEEAKTQAREERNRSEPFAYEAHVATGSPSGRTIGAHMQLEIDNLTRTFEELRPDLLSEAVELIARAPRVWLAGFGAEEGIALAARQVLARLRPDVRVVGGDPAGWTEALSMAGPEDAMLLLSLPPRPRGLATLAGHARTTRINIITLSDHAFAARARRFSRIVIPCHMASHGAIPTHTALLSALRILAVGYAARAGQSATQRMAALDELGEELSLFERPD
ncbi:MurR/RpiR family transcriptional regulator [uncultured Jannaschia sp.]|uniref:MurR/RpiR family transcriptional regulator n=1 Tax=uncultured Jannaschia sp. TaxID=293347 RepID=UPI0026252996|nr:MurR/RpiR family transcriptional regulator [uncultured Jannaschia sp.]